MSTDKKMQFYQLLRDFLTDYLVTRRNFSDKTVRAYKQSLKLLRKYFSDEMGIVYPEHRSTEDMDKGIFEVTYKGRNNLKLMPTDEDSKIHPTSIYGITKQNQEQMVLVACSAIGIAAIGLRYQNVYGPGQSLSNPYTGILSIFSTQIKNNLPINIFEDGKESRDFVYIDDVVTATILAIENKNADNKVYNVGNGVATTVLEVAETLMKNYGQQVSLNITGNYRIGDIRHNYADLSKINTELGFKPEISFAEGISRFCNWVSSQQLQQSNYEKSLSEMKQKGLFK